MSQETSAARRLADRYRSAVEPRGDGLPRVRVLLALPALLLILGAILVGSGINGSSSGAYWNSVATGEDPDLVAGSPQLIRSDEWNTGTSWIISQAAQGYPERSATFPGGMDSAIPYDLPRWDWSVAFRPHLLGYLLLDVEHGTAWRWWSSAFAAIAAAYILLVVLAPRRPMAGALLAVGFIFSPFFQWWYQSSTFWPVAWGLATLAALAWATRTARRRERWIWAALIAYLTAVMAMGIYLPYIIPVVYVVAFFAIALVIRWVRTGGTWRGLFGAVTPTLAAGAVGLGVTGVFLVQKSSTVVELVSTVYPGERLIPTGSAQSRDLLSTVNVSFVEWLENTGGFLQNNASEASSFFLLGLFLLPIVVWLIVRAVRTSTRLPWEAIALAAISALFLAFMIVPGWDAVAHLLYLDRIRVERIRIGLGVASLAMVGAVIAALDEQGKPAGRLLSALTAAAFVASQGLVAIGVVRSSGFASLQTSAGSWWLLTLAGAAAVFFIARGRYGIGALAFVLATVPPSTLVNPLYVGVLDLRDTQVSQAVVAADDAAPAAWVGIGSPVVAALLVESGVETYNGVQGAPSPEMWDDVDPAGRYADEWNRIGFVNWMQDEGEPVVTNPSQDQIVVTLDACSDFAQADVGYVLSDHPLVDPCLSEIGQVDQIADFRLYEVVAPASR